MNIIYTVYYYTKALLTDKMTIFLKILTPIIMMLVLGTALKNDFSVGQLGISRIVVIAEDDIYKMLEQNMNSNYLELSKATDMEEARNVFNAGGVDAIIKIDYENSDAHEIVAYIGTNDNIKRIVIGSSVNDLKNISNIIFSLAEEDAEMYQIFEEYVEQESLLRTSEISIVNSVPRAIDYYGVTMLVITLMSGAAFSCDYFGSIFTGSIGMRIKSSCMKVYENYIGMFGSMFLVNLIQGIITMMIMKYIFRGNWGSHVLWNIFIIISASAMATAIGIFVCTAFNDVKQASKVLNMLLQIFAFIAGGYIRLEFGILKYVSPNYYVQSALFQTIYGGNGVDFKIYIIGFCVVTLLLSCFAILLGRRKRDYAA